MSRNAASIFFAVAAVPVGLAGGWIFAGFFVHEPTKEASPNRFTRLEGTTAPRRGVRNKPWLTREAQEQVLQEPKSPEACRAALEEADALKASVHPLVVATLRDRALRSWIELDPTGALAFAEASLHGKSRANIAEDLFRVWLDLDVDSAMNAFAQASPATVQTATTGFFDQLAQIDPVRAADALVDPKWNVHGNQAFFTASKVFATWAHRDPKAAAERAVSIEKSWFGSTRAVAAVWGESDPLAAWEFFKSTEVASVALQALGGPLLSLGIDPTSEMKRPALSHERSEIAQNWVAHDLDSALSFAQTLPHGDPWKKDLLTQVARSLATADPDRALEIFPGSGGTGPLKNLHVLREAFASLAATDMDATMDRWRETPDDQRAGALSGIMTHQFASDRAEACRLCRRLLDDPASSEFVLPALSTALSYGHGGAPQDLADVLDAVPELAPLVTSHFLNGWVMVAPESAAELIADKVIAADGNEINEPRAIAELTISRPEFTSQWLTTLPAGHFRTNAARVLGANWSKLDLTATSAWIETLPDGPMKTAAGSHLDQW